MDSIKVTSMFKEIEELLKDSADRKERENLLCSLLLLRQMNTRWESIGEITDNRSFKEALISAMEEAAYEKREYRDIMMPESVRNISGRRLRRVYDIFTGMTFEEDGNERETEQFFEHMMSRFLADGNDRKPGEFYTPKQISKLMAELIQPEQGSVYDPCCGSSSLLIGMAEYMSKRDKDFRLYGQEDNDWAWKTAKLNLCLHGFFADLGERADDVFFHDLHEDLKADYVVGNPPFRSKDWGREALLGDFRWKYGVPGKRSGEFAWLQHMLYHLKEKGRMCVILSCFLLESDSPSDRGIRKGLVSDDVIEAVIVFPAGMFYTTKISVSLWVLKKGKEAPCRGRTLFIDAREAGESSGRLITLSDQGQKDILSVWQEYNRGMPAKRQGFSAVAGQQEIAAADFSLAPERYITYKKPEQPTKEELDRKEEELKEKLSRLLYENSVVLKDIFDK